MSTTTTQQGRHFGSGRPAIPSLGRAKLIHEQVTEHLLKSVWKSAKKIHLYAPTPQCKQEKEAMQLIEDTYREGLHLFFGKDKVTGKEGHNG